MRRRVISVGSVLLALAALVVVLLNATLVDRRGPAVASVSLSAPVDGQASLALTLTAIEVQFSEPVVPASVERRFRIAPYVAGAITWDGSTATFTPSGRLPADTEFTVTIDPGFEDLAGNPAPAGVDGFRFRTVGPPTVAAVDPPDGADGVPVDASIAITFDRLMDTTAAEGAISIEPAVDVRASWSGPQLTLAFEPRLQFGTTYTLTVGASAADTDGSRLRSRFTTRFTTVEAGLRIARTVPTDGVAGISVRTGIAVLFDGPIDPATVAEALTVTPAVEGDLRVVPLPSDEAPRATPGQTPEPPGTVLLFQPSNPLAPHTTYTVTLDPVVARAGDADQVAPGRTWRFTTGQPTASGHNHIAYLSSRGGTRDVWLMNPDGSAPRQLTSGLAPVSAFDVSPDGTTVAFAAAGDVVTMAIDGSGEADLTDWNGYEYAPRFSPDGRLLLVARRDADGADAGWWLVPRGVDGDERQLLPSGAPDVASSAIEGDGILPGSGLPPWSSRSAWEPAGRWLLVTAADGQVSLVDTQAQEPAPMARAVDLTASSAGAWSSGLGAFLIVGRAGEASTDGLYAVTPDGDVRRLADGTGSVAAAADGLAALLATGPGGVTHVAVGQPGVRPPAALTSEPSLADRWPTFSPDGRSVVFGRVDASSETTSAGIWTIDVAGGRPRALTTDGAYPRWLP